MNIEIPKNISINDFFNEFIVDTFNKFKDEFYLLDLEFRVGVEILGAGGSDWCITYNSGELEVEESIADDPFFTLRLDIKDWELALKMGLGDFLLGVVNFDVDFSKKLISQDKINRVVKENGSINIYLEDILINDDKLNMNFGIIFGEPLDVDPSVDIKLDQRTFNLILNDYKNIYQLISKKEIELSGDFAFLMKILTIIFLGF